MGKELKRRVQVNDMKRNFILSQTGKTAPKKKPGKLSYNTRVLPAYVIRIVE